MAEGRAAMYGAGIVSVLVVSTSWQGKGDDADGSTMGIRKVPDKCVVRRFEGTSTKKGKKRGRARRSSTVAVC